MKADKIIKNAKIFTADKNQPMASALAVKDGKFVYVGDEAGLSAYEGVVTDLGGMTAMCMSPCPWDSPMRQRANALPATASRRPWTL